MDCFGKNSSQPLRLRAPVALLLAASRFDTAMKRLSLTLSRRRTSPFPEALLFQAVAARQEKLA